jgi:hypothetical protein
LIGDRTGRPIGLSKCLARLESRAANSYGFVLIHYSASCSGIWHVRTAHKNLVDAQPELKLNMIRCFSPTAMHASKVLKDVDGVLKIVAKNKGNALM